VTFTLRCVIASDGQISSLGFWFRGAAIFRQLHQGEALVLRLSLGTAGKVSSGVAIGSFRDHGLARGTYML